MLNWDIQNGFLTGESPRTEARKLEKEVFVTEASILAKNLRLRNGGHTAQASEMGVTWAAFRNVVLKKRLNQFV